MATIGPTANRSTHLWLALGLSAMTSAIFIVRAGFIADGRLTFSLFDDAMVSMRYASNLADGHGLVWNPGEPAVEGYSNLLWTLWMALLHLLPVPTRLTSLLVSLSGAALIVATALVSSRIAARLSGERGSAAPLIAAVSVGLCYPLLFWTLRGMEVGLIAFLLALSVDWAMRIGDGEQHLVGRLAVCLALLAVTRPDAVVPALIIAVCTAAVAPNQRLGTLAMLCAAPIGAVGLQTLWRVSVYGEWLPNTYYLKMTGVPLMSRVTRGLGAITGTFTLYLWIALAFALAAWHSYRRADRALVVLLPAVLMAYSVYVGGDAWEWMPYTNRHLTPAFVVLLPAVAAALVSREPRVVRTLAVLALACAALELWHVWHSPSRSVMAMHVVAAALAGAAAMVWYRGRPAGAAAILTGLLLVTAVSGPGYLHWLQTGGAHVADDAAASRVGLLIKRTTATETRIAVAWAGAMPYFAERAAIDLLGKSDPQIARMAPVRSFFPGHDKYDYAHSVGSLRPDLILQLWNATPATRDWIVGLGYDHLVGDAYGRHDSPWIDRARLAAVLPETIP